MSFPLVPAELAFAGDGARATGRLAPFEWRRASGEACPAP